MSKWKQLDAATSAPTEKELMYWLLSDRSCVKAKLSEAFIFNRVTNKTWKQSHMNTHMWGKLKFLGKYLHKYIYIFASASTVSEMVHSYIWQSFKNLVMSSLVFLGKILLL